MLSASKPIAKGYKTFEGCAFSADNLATLDIAVGRAGGSSFLKQCDKSLILSGRDYESLKILINHLAALRPSADNILAAADHTAATNSIVQQAIDVFDLKTFHGLDPSKTLRSADEIVHIVRFCSEVGARSEWQHLLKRLESPPVGIPAGLYTTKVLAPFIPVLRDYLRSQKLDLATEPFKGFVAQVLKTFGTSAMAQKPKELVPLLKIECTCTDCGDLKDFFAGDNLSVSFSRSNSAREHLIRQLVIPKSFGVTFKTVKRKSTFALEVTKPENMTAAGLAAENESRGKTLLAVLGDQAAQRGVLGPDFTEVVAQILRKNVAGVKRTAEEGQGHYRVKKKRSS
ncbi:hypothetical protein C8R47DRAFT_1167238 [Mycena vitilis]|nr:hypothetical protein C8R47DRAFT_1167238 [Mycena vitilis]